MLRFPSLAALAALVSSCASYVTPGRGADMTLFQPTTEAEQDIARAFARKPTAAFPASVALVRVQEPRYSSYTVRDTSGGGNYTVVTVRDVETEADFERLAKLPQIRAIAPVTRLLVPGHLEGPEDLRRIAAELHADLVLVYTIDTAFIDEEHGGVLAVVSLGILPTHVAGVDTTASAVLLDTRTGYLYGTAEATERARGQTNVWASKGALDAHRRKTERAAFEQLLAEFERTWGGVVAAYAPPSDGLATESAAAKP